MPLSRRHIFPIQKFELKKLSENFSLDGIKCAVDKMDEQYKLSSIFSFNSFMLYMLIMSLYKLTLQLIIITTYIFHIIFLVKFYNNIISFYMILKIYNFKYMFKINMTQPNMKLVHLSLNSSLIT